MTSGSSAGSGSRAFFGGSSAAILARTTSRAFSASSGESCCVFGTAVGGPPIFARTTWRAFSASSGDICCVFKNAAGGLPILALTSSRALSASSGDICCVLGSAGSIAGRFPGAAAACMARTFFRASAASSLLRTAVLSTGIPAGDFAGAACVFWVRSSGNVPVSFFSLSVDVRRFGGAFSPSSLGGTVGRGYLKSRRRCRPPARRSE